MYSCDMSVLVKLDGNGGDMAWLVFSCSECRRVGSVNQRGGSVPEIDEPYRLNEPSRCSAPMFGANASDGSVPESDAEPS